MSSIDVKQTNADCQKLVSSLLDAVKQCQIRFGGKKELATDDDSCVSCICAQLEAVLQHGLRKSVKPSTTTVTDAKLSVIEVMSKSLKISESADIVFWHFIREFLSRHEQDRYYLLKNIINDVGRGRAWLRSTLNEHSLERYLHILLSDSELLDKYYTQHALMRNQEFSTMLPNMAAGLGSILFAININNIDLNSFRDANAFIVPVPNSSRSTQEEPKPVVLSSTAAGKEKRKKIRVPAQIAIFDDEMENRFPKVSCSAPSTCLSSPVDLYSRNSCFKMILNSSQLDEDEVEVKQKSSSDPDILSRSYLSDDAVETYFGSTEVPRQIPVALGGFACIEATEEEEARKSQLGSSTSSEDEDKLTELVSSTESKDKDELERIKDNFQTKKQQSSTRSPLLEPLTPINDISVGELFPVGNNEEVHSEDSVSIPSYSEDTENAALGLVLAQKALRNNPSPKIIDQSSSVPSQIQNAVGILNKTEDLSADDLKQALLSVMQKKDEIEEQNCSLRSLLEKEMELSASLRAENDNMKTKYQDTMSKMHSKLQTVSRENELLKHQLKKYIGAVQVLKRDGTEAHEALACLNRESSLGISDRNNFHDYHFEATEYEKKLIQVAEMHGELMEFNDRLHRLLSQKELDVRRLREELVELRGPFPDDALTSDDDISITSDYDTSSLTAAARSHINVWIPSVFLTGRSSDVHHVYQVYIRIRDDEWNIYRRYAQFYALHRELRRKIAPVNTFDFPPKKVIGNKDTKFVEERRKRLQHYLRCVVNLMVQNNNELAANPDKGSLISLLPFFSEFANNQGSQRRGQRRGRVNPFFSRSNSNQQSTADDSPSSHYAGL